MEVGDLYKTGMMDTIYKEVNLYFPREIIEDKKYENLKSIDILLYSFLLGMTSIFDALSIHDQQGQAMAQIPNEFLIEQLNIGSKTTLLESKKRLEESELIATIPTGRGNIYYTKHYDELREAVG
ncbi:hypothetical protein [Hutsoniella sourekii]|uniref:hypothetical protein n=1 Tax=Hutsoniella sourekii TaxID=87650 RepID=UPI0004B60D01|nr:hypothetical protein [Hutsoniella sourekii]